MPLHGPRVSVHIVLAFFAVPYVRGATEAIVRLIDGPA